MSSNKNQVIPASYIGLDVLTGRQRDGRKRSAAVTNQDVPFICPLHGVVKQGHSRWNKKEEKKGIMDFITACFGRTDFERKLNSYGVHVRVNKRTTRMIEDDSKESDLLTRGELNVLPVDKLRELIESMDNEISTLNTEMMQLLEEKHVMSTENAFLKNESKELEERVKKMTRPWINRYPQCDELTRAFLLS